MSKSSRVPAKTKAKAAAKTTSKASPKAPSRAPSRAKVAAKGKPKAKAKAKAKAQAPSKPKVKTAGNARTKETARKEPALLQLVRQALEDMKAVDIRVLDVRGVSDVTDYMVIAGGTSDRHLRSVADRVIQMCKASGQRPLGVEGEQQGEWVLVDLPDVMVHIMLPRTRELYQLEQLWDADSTAGRG